MPDYIPASDAMFNIWQGTLVTSVQTNTAAWGILPADVTALAAAQALWTTAYAKGGNKNNRMSPDVQLKDDVLHSYTKTLRAFVAQWLANNPKVPNSERIRMGLTVKTGTHTPTAAPSTVPVATIDFSVRLQHSITFTDQDTPQSKAKPEGVHGCEVWCKLGDATAFEYLGLCTRTPFVAKNDDVDAGKTASYRLRWINAKGEQGPWSSVVSAMVVG